MSDRIRAAATILAVSSSALMQAELNRNASAGRQIHHSMAEVSAACPVLSADGYTIGTLKKLDAGPGKPGRLTVQVDATSCPDLPSLLQLPANATVDRRGRVVLATTKGDLVDAARSAAA